MRGCMRNRAVAARDQTVRDGRDDPASRDEVVRATAQLRADGRRQIGRREDRLERAVPREQRARGLLADPRYARKAIGWVAAQEGVVDVAVAGDAVLLVDPRRVDARDLRHAAQRVQHGHVRVGDQGEEVAVTRHDLDGVVRALRERRDDVLGLEAVRARGRQPERVEEPLEEDHPGRDRILLLDRGRDAVCLVRRERVDAERGPPVGVQRDPETRGLAIGQETREEAEKAVDRVRLGAVGSAHRRYRVIRAIREARAVDHEQRPGGAGHATALLPNTLPIAAMMRSFSSCVPIEMRTQPLHPGHMEMSRMSTPSRRNPACTPAVSPSWIRTSRKFVTDGKTVSAGTRASAAATRSRSTRQRSTRPAMSPSERTIFRPTASVIALTLYGSCDARYSSASSGCATSTPSRSPAAARTFENVLLMTIFGCVAIAWTSEVPAKSEYASSSSTSVVG